MTQFTQQRSTWLAARAAGLDAEELWLHYFSVGGDLTVFDLDAYLHGAHPLPVAERNLIALAVNELVDDLSLRLKAEFVHTPFPDQPRTGSE